MLKRIYMYSVLDMCVKYILKPELQSQLLDENWLLLATCDIILGFSYVEKCASDFPCLGLCILPEDFIKSKQLQKLHCLINNVFFSIWISQMYKGQAIILLRILWNSHVLDSGQINWAVWKPGHCCWWSAAALWQWLQPKAEEGAARLKLFLNSSLLCFVLPRMSQLSLDLLWRGRGSVELVFLSSSGPNHPNSYPCWNLLPPFPVKQGIFFFLCKWGIHKNSN